MTERFEFPFKENYAEIDGVRMHYVDEGAGPPIVMVHGQPTWSYLYRKMIPPLVAAGYRCVAPDLMGFGLSDKPTNEAAYTLRRHVELVTGLVEHLELKGITTVGQDWGGPIVLRYAIDHQDNVQALVILNTLVRITAIPAFFKVLFKAVLGSGGFSSFLSKRLDLFRLMMFSGPKLGFSRPVDKRAMAQYRMPHPTPDTRSGIAAFPKMIPTDDSHPNARYISEIEETLRRWDIPVLVMFSDKDRVFSLQEGRRIAAMVPNGRFHAVNNAGHFLQEDAGEEIAERMVRFLAEEAGVAAAQDLPRSRSAADEAGVGEVWERIVQHAGQTFSTKRGVEFTYTVSGASLVTSRADSPISRGQFARALELWPADGPGALGGSVGGRTYVWALLDDRRILGGAAE